MFGTWKHRGLVVIAVATSMVCASTAWAEVITVNSFDDRPDADPNDGVCDADLTQPGLQCTLRAAVQHANLTPGADTIVLAPGKYRLRLKGGGESLAATGDLDLNDDVTIEGSGAGTTIIDCAAAKDRAFDVGFGVTVTIRGLTIQRGRTQNRESGAAIRNLGGDVTLEDCVILKCKSADTAGGFENESGTATFTRVWIDRCAAKDDAGGIDVDGGSLDMDSCTISRCRTNDEGGGLENSGRVVSMVNCTISGNRAKTHAGGISMEDGAVLTIVNSTIAFNKSKSGAGAPVSTALRLYFG